jgi:hypothetical protein
MIDNQTSKNNNKNGPESFGLLVKQPKSNHGRDGPSVEDG